MKALPLILITACFFSLAFRYYSAFVKTKVLMLDSRNVTPAVSLKDNKDYIPTDKWVVLGHHFSAIAGAGPLIGPVLAIQYGWGPGFFWIILGAVFAGCIHDTIVLFGSVRYQGKPITAVARESVSALTGTSLSIILLFVVVVLLGGFGVIIVNALHQNPWGLFAVFMTMPISLVFGFYMLRKQGSSIAFGTAIGVGLVCLSVLIGPYILATKIGEWFMLDRSTLALLVPVYSFATASLPLWLLVVPRSCLSTFIKVGVTLLIAICVCIVNPELKMSFTTKFISGGGPIIPGPVWPYVFITIACGAISGFHALIASGTTPKLIKDETYIPMVGMGAMLIEGMVALMALLVTATMFQGDYFAINTPGKIFQGLNMSIVEIPTLNELIGLNIAHRPGGAISFAVGIATLFKRYGYTVKYVFQFILLFEAMFILTAFDSGTRVARYILQDVLGNVYKPLKQTNWVPGIIFTSAVVSIFWGYFTYTGDISSVWPLFGVTNQALAVAALTIGTTLILKTNKNCWYALCTFIPFLFIAITTFTAGIMNIGLYFKRLQYLNGFISVVTLSLIATIVVDNIRIWINLVKKGYTQKTVQ